MENTQVVKDVLREKGLESAERLTLERQIRREKLIRLSREWREKVENDRLVTKDRLKVVSASMLFKGVKQINASDWGAKAQFVGRVEGATKAGKIWRNA